MSKQEFANLKDAIVTKFLTEYEGERVDESGGDVRNGMAELQK